MSTKQSVESTKWLETLKTEVNNPRDEMTFYKETASQYDDHQIVLQYNGPNRCIEIIKSYEKSSCTEIPRNGKVIDIGAGTGLSGLALKSVGFLGEIDALEPSEHMFAQAREKKLYSKHFDDLLLPEKETSVVSNSYDLAVSVGVFNKNSTTPGCVKEVIRMVKPGGLVVVVQNQQYWQGEGGFEAKIEELQREKVVRLETLEFFDGYVSDNGGVAYIMRKL